jgi:hypothetical protein
MELIHKLSRKDLVKKLPHYGYIKKSDMLCLPI